MKWESVESCAFCGGDKYRKYMESTEPKWYSGEPFHLDTCVKCQLVFANPRPDRYELYKYYLKGTGNAAIAVERKLARPSVYSLHRKAIESAGEAIGSRVERIYDMGFGAGSLLEEAKGMGMEAWGNDINQAGVERLSALGITALHGFSRDVEIPKGYFDIVTNLDYLEHSYEPFSDLLRCHEALRVGGALYLKTLYLDCPDHLMAGARWKLFGQGHFHFFRQRVLADMVKKAGFALHHIKLSSQIHIIAKKKK